MGGFIQHGVVFGSYDPVLNCASCCGVRSIRCMGSFKGMGSYWKLGNVDNNVTVQLGGARNYAGMDAASWAHAIGCVTDRAHAANYLHFCRCDLGGDRLVDKFPYFTNVPNNSLKPPTGIVCNVLPDIGGNWIGYKSFLIPDV